MKYDDIKKIYLKASTGISQYPKDISSISKSKKYNKKIFISGGIGDFLAIQRFCIEPDFDGTFFLVTRSWHEIGEIIHFTNPSAEYITVLKQFPADFYSFFTLEHFLACSSVRKLRYPPDIENSEDYSISNVFPEINQNKLKLLENRIITQECADIKNFKLPKEYISLVLQSNRDAGHAARGRNFTSEEIENTCSCSSLPKICLFCQCVDPNPNFLHLKNTTILQSIEILKKSSGYIGIDSWLSVIAGWVLPSDKVKIKCINNHGIENACCYWPSLDPKKSIVPKI